MVTNQEVSYPSGDITLAGTLFTPQTAQPCPGLVFVHGAGDETREGWRKRAETIAGQGIAALIYDKRGTGSSTGDWHDASYQVLAADALAGVRFLKACGSTLDPQQIGLCGCSEGGWVVPLAATLSSDIAFVVVVSAALTSPTIQEYYHWEKVISKRCPNRVTVALSMVGVKGFYNLIRLFPKSVPGVVGFWRRTIFFDPIPTWQSLRQPVLALWGDQDIVVPPHQSAHRLEQVLRDAGHSDYTIRVFPGADHGIGALRETADGQKQWGPAPGYLDTIVDWVRKQARQEMQASAPP